MGGWLKAVRSCLPAQHFLEPHLLTNEEVESDQENGGHWGGARGEVLGWDEWGQADFPYDKKPFVPGNKYGSPRGAASPVRV